MIDVTLGATAAAPVTVPARYLNRHGLITGGTGSGKSVSVIGMAEALARVGVPSIVTDVKGDISGIAAPSTAAVTGGVTFLPWWPEACRVKFWDIYGEQGHWISASLNAFGAPLAARAMGLSDAQTGVLEVAFAVAEATGQPLDTLADLRAILAYCVEHRQEIGVRYGLITAQSAAGIGRAVLQLERSGGDIFFNRRTTPMADILEQGGIVSVLDCVRLVNHPRLYGAVLLWLLDTLGRELPEVGDADKPVLALFLDEAHLIFNECPDEVIRAVDKTIRLIRSKGVAVFFASQSPADVPDAIARQLHLRVQHALRAVTNKDRALLKAVADSMPPGDGFKVADALEALPTGTALVTFLGEDSRPTATQIVKMQLPRCRLTPLTADERAEINGPLTAPLVTHTTPTASIKNPGAVGPVLERVGTGAAILISSVIGASAVIAVWSGHPLIGTILGVGTGLAYIRILARG